MRFGKQERCGEKQAIEILDVVGLAEYVPKLGICQLERG